MPSVEQERQFYRHPLVTPVQAEMSIAGVDGSPIHTKSAEILLLNLSGNGLAFESCLDMPIKRNLILNVKFSFHEEEYEVKGRLIRKSYHADKEELTYAIHIQADEALEMRLVSLVNKLSIEERKRRLGG